MKLSRIFRDIPIEYANVVSIGKKASDKPFIPKEGLHFKDGQLFQPDMDIRSIHYDSRNVEPGGLFVALPGQTFDGHTFIPNALDRGATAIVTQSDHIQKVSFGTDSRPDMFEFLHIQVENTRESLARISAAFFDYPSNQLCMIGVTGTNGKGSTVCLVENILLKSGARPGVIGTQNFRYDGKIYDNPMTTPEATDLQRILYQMLNAGLTHVVMEVSSHAIDLHRVDQCWFDVGVFTNLSQDHLDYHGDMETYWSCKKKWFTDSLRVGPKKDHAVAVLNCIDPKGLALSALLVSETGENGFRLITVGEKTGYDIYPENVSFDLTGITGRMSIQGHLFDFKSVLVGKHNLENMLCAAGVGAALNLPPDMILSGIEAVSAVPGRMEFIPNPYRRFVYVDYAHSPDALNRVLIGLRNLTSGRIIVIFGCGGNRDRGKRPQMGQIAACRCDLAVVTSDNPRGEDPEDIIKQICNGIHTVTRNYYSPDDLAGGFSERGYTIEPDRKRAITLGILSSGPGDTILIAGKGNETYQIIGNRVLPFDDRDEVRTALNLLASKINHE